mmetsp:Transcript_1621/g.3737  ORF Transcript_1621/g.3737 Transcript_1621/m.3737 type:complete len:278 (-) Transcript_1621:46-879(-)
MSVKRQKRSYSPGSQQPDNSEDDGDSFVPCDTVLAIISAKHNFRQSSCEGFVPIVLKSQLYCTLKDHTKLDREVDELRQKGEIRVFKLSTSPSDYAVHLTDDYVWQLQDAKERQLSQGVEPDRAQVFDWFIHRVLPRCAGTAIGHDELLRLLSRPAKHQAPSRASAGAAAPGDGHVALLLKSGCLSRQRRPGQPEAYWFAIPGAGPVLSSILNGRQELLAAFKKRYRHGVLEKEITKKPLRSSRLGAGFHIRDLVGLGLVERIETTSGTMLRPVQSA